MTARHMGARAPLVLPSEAAGKRAPSRAFRIGSDEERRFRLPVQLGCVRLLAIDPGLDRLSLAYFDTPTDRRGALYQSDVTRKGAAFTHVAFVTTEAGPDWPSRLAALGRTLAGQLHAMRPSVVYVEQPEKAGIYGRLQGESGQLGGKVLTSLMMNYAALGVVCAVTSEYASHPDRACRMELVKPSTLGGRKKEERLEFARGILRMTGHGGELRNDDDADAFGVGLGATWKL